MSQHLFIPWCVCKYICTHLCACEFVTMYISAYVYTYVCTCIHTYITFNTVYVNLLMYTIHLYVGIGNDTLGRSRSSLQILEVNDFLLSVKEKFTEVLLPVESISKQGLLGKG